MRCLKAISLIVVYGMLTLLIRLNACKLVWIYEFGFVISSIIIIGSGQQNIVNLDTFFIFVVIGYILSPFVTIAVYWITFSKIPHIKFSLSITWETLLNVVIEETIWRHLLLLWVERLKLNIYLSILMSFMVLILFIFSHSNINSVRNGIDMFLYSTILLLFAYLLPGANIGLHLGRNVSCENALEERDEGNKYMRN